jgi:RimJ/RimL family protein N-acetyltransferase
MTGLLLHTERFELWRPAASDLAQLYALTEHDETRRYLGGLVPDMGDSHARLLRNGGSWLLHGYGRPEIIGNCGVFRSWRGLPGLNDAAEAGWIIHRDHCGKGVAGEVMRAVLDWFDATHGRQRIGCMIEQGNTASQRLAAALGFVEYLRHPDAAGRELVLYERQ